MSGTANAPGMTPPNGKGMGPGGKTPFGRPPGGSLAPQASGGPMDSQQPGPPGSGGAQPSINPVTGMQQFNFGDAQMSGSMQPPPQMAPAAQAPQGGGGSPQLPPQVLQMMMQRMQGGGGAPGGMPQGPPPAMQGPQGQPNQGNPGQTGGGPPPPRLAPPGSQQPMTPAQMASQGRNGDSLVAHLTPGEIEVPPQVQTPQLIHAIQQAFARFGISPKQFTAGSPVSSHNPATGAPEYNLLSSILPMLAAGGAAVAAPALAPAALQGALGSALIPAAAGLGAAGATAATGGNSQQTLLSGVGAAGGSALAGGLSGGASSAAAGNPTASATPNPFNTAPLGSPALQGPTASGLPLQSAAAMQGPTTSGLPLSTALSGAAPQNGILGQMGSLKPALGAGIGAAIGGSLAPGSTASILPPGFNNPLPPLNKNFGQLNGSGTTSSPTFQNYNPYTAVAGPNPGFTFYPQS